MPDNDRADEATEALKRIAAIRMLKPLGMELPPFDFDRYRQHLNNSGTTNEKIIARAALFEAYYEKAKTSVEEFLAKVQAKIVRARIFRQKPPANTPT